VRSRDELVAALSLAFAGWSRNSILQQLEAHGIPAGPINTVADVFSDSQVQHRAMRLELDSAHVHGGTVPGVRTPLRFSESTLATGRASPGLGEHDAEIRRAAGWVTPGTAKDFSR
jgi:crotonobetainyl-CoA:carnitine CoA-transferase CaiB-like acyl-CoA transferase